jgi:hypothetical protein
MKSSSLFRYAILLGMACSTFVVRCTEPLFRFAVVIARAAKKLALDGFVLAAGQRQAQFVPFLPLVKAKAFVLRLIKRARPEVSSSWRMCPST